MSYWSRKSRSTTTSLLLTLAITFGAITLGPLANAQVSEPGVKAAPDFSKLAVKPAKVGFKKLVFPGGSSPEPGSFTIINSGRGTTILNATVAPPAGKGAGAFSIVGGGVV